MRLKILKKKRDSEGTTLEIHINTPDGGELDAVITTRNILDYSIQLKSYRNNHVGDNRNDDSLGLSSFFTVNPDHQNIGTQNSLSCSDYKDFWISWLDGHIKIGSGSTLFDNVFADWRDPVPIEVKSIGLLTFWVQTGEWRIHVEDLFTGLFSGCSEDNNKADMIVLQSMEASRFACGSICPLWTTVSALTLEKLQIKGIRLNEERLCIFLYF
ncbi:unnamed protein product [Mytilus edulis]|uniref:Farnesoic acid O-methyl transferase domain-containing protein n=1 Tax=Mytilus edulis TaxID=6550 RepID=A0A8S3RI82_MYTED|nr:unnamed protein product [Mytilus edulis]